MTLRLSMRAAARAEIQAVREYECLQLSLWACSSVLFPLGRQYSSSLLYLLQNMEDSCFLMKTINLKNHTILYKLTCYEKLQIHLVVNISCIHQCIISLLETQDCYQETENVFLQSLLMHEVPDTK